MYLVLRVCRACNHRGTAKRPSTPSHSASRHSIFFSLHPLRSPPPPLSPPTRVPGGTFFPGAPTALSHTARSCIFLSSLSPRRRCAHSIIIIGFRSWTADAPRILPPFPLSLLRPYVSLFVSPVRSCLPTHISRPESVALHYGLTKRDEMCANFSAGAPSPLSRSRAEKLKRGGIYYRDAR